MGYIVFNSLNNKYFTDGEFKGSNREEASILAKDKADELMKLFNGIMLSKPIKIERA